MILESNLKIFLAQFFNQWEAKHIVHCTRDFSRPFSELKVVSRNSDWFIELFACVVIGPSYYLGIGFLTVKRAPTVVLLRIQDVG